MEWVKDIAMVGIGWLLGLFTLPIAKDLESKEKCLQSLYELKRLLWELSKYTNFPSRSDNGYYEKLIKIKSIIEKIDVEKTALAFPCYQLNDLIEKSLDIFKQLDPEHENSAFHISQSVVALIHAWDNDIYRPTFEKISKIQKYISQPFLGRFCAWIYSLCFSESFSLSSLLSFSLKFSKS